MNIIYTLLGSSLVTFSLIYFMAIMTSTKGNVSTKKSESVEISFLRTQKDSEANARTRSLPPPPDNPAPPPEQSNLELSNEKPSSDSFALDVPSFKEGLQIGSPFSGKTSGSATLMPLVRILPQMPRRAAMRGIEGYVVIRFIVAKDGTTKNIQVTEAIPPRVFDREARKAIARWKYKPQVQDGKPIEVEQTVKLDFKLEEGS